MMFFYIALSNVDGLVMLMLVIRRITCISVCCMIPVLKQPLLIWSPLDFQPVCRILQCIRVKSPYLPLSYEYFPEITY